MIKAYKVFKIITFLALDMPVIYFRCFITQRHSRKSNHIFMSSHFEEFLAGVKAELPITLGVIPFGMIYGILALGAGLPMSVAQAMSAIIFAGSSQFVAAQLFSLSTQGIVIVATVGIINLRHLLYSASIAPHLNGLSSKWKYLLAYLLTDEAYAITITRFKEDSTTLNRHWFFLGAGLTLWLSWQLSTAAGIFLGTAVPAGWSLDFTLALTFIALVMPALKDRASLGAALTAGMISALIFSAPYKLGLFLASVGGILVGLWLEARS